MLYFQYLPAETAGVSVCQGNRNPHNRGQLLSQLYRVYPRHLYREKGHLLKDSLTQKQRKQQGIDQFVKPF